MYVTLICGCCNWQSSDFAIGCALGGALECALECAIEVVEMLHTTKVTTHSLLTCIYACRRLLVQVTVSMSLQVDLSYTCDGLAVQIYLLFKSKYVTQTIHSSYWSTTRYSFPTLGYDLSRIYSI